MGSLDDPPVPISLDNKYESNQESKSLLPEALTKEIEADTKAIVAITPLNPEALSAVPVNNKLSKRSELSQRRTRRPFSVTEVESLVEAVENLGTGRCEMPHLAILFLLNGSALSVNIVLILSIKIYAEGVMLKFVHLMMQTTELMWI